MEKVLMNVVLHLPKKVIEQLQDETEEFNFDLDELISFALIAAVEGKIDSSIGCVYERIDWAWMRREGICE